MSFARSKESNLLKTTTSERARHRQEPGRPLPGVVGAEATVAPWWCGLRAMVTRSMMIIATVTGVAAGSVEAAERRTAAGPVLITEMATGLYTPWGIGFLPDGHYLVTERDGQLLHFAPGPGGQRTAVAGVPDVFDRGQGGLLDVAVARDFAESRQIFLTYSKPYRRGRRAGTALAVATLSADGSRLDDVRVLFEMLSPSSGSRHFGSRVAEAEDGSLYLTIGDRGGRDKAQNLALHHGKIIRIHRDGSVPEDNPFFERSGARPEIWSWGHRNPQGLAFDSDGDLWAVEHGPMGGDEINRIGKGLNYGWPIIGYGRHYSGAQVGIGHAREGLEQPEFYWDPSIAPCGMMIYSGRLWPEWRGQFFIASLKFDLISRLDPEGRVSEEERLAFPETLRVRDVREAPDGSIWFLSEGNGAVYRMTPKR